MQFYERFYIGSKETPILLPGICQFEAFRAGHGTRPKNINKKFQKPLDKLPFSCYNTKAV